VIRIRPATPGDRGFIAGLAHRFAEFELPPWRSARDVAEGTAWRLEEALGNRNERSAIVIAESAGGEPLGFAWFLLVEDFYTGRDVAKLSEIAVVRDGTGAGAALMEATRLWASEHGCNLIVLNVMEGNVHAREFYERHGFSAEYTMMVRKL
jgi:GNAT superfamily N-acetyltransferase